VQERRLKGKRWAGILLLLALLAYLFAESAARWDASDRINRAQVLETPTPAIDPASPTGYAFGQRRLILAPYSVDGYQWIMQAQQVVNGRGARIHFVDWDNAPAGRESHWSSGLVWWLAGLAWLDHAASGRPLPLAVETIAPIALPILLALLLLALTPLLVWRFGLLAASLVAAGLVLYQPVSVTFSVGYLDHHGLVAVCALLMVLFLAAGGAGWRRNPDFPADSLQDSDAFLTAWLPERPAARKWFIASAVAGAAGLWINAATQVPVLMGIGLGAAGMALGMRTASAIARPWVPAPTLWRLWGAAGAVASLSFYLLEYFPQLWTPRLEVNHPLYALAWLGTGDLLARFWAAPSREPGASPLKAILRALPAVLALLLPPAVIFLAKDRVFALADPFLWALHIDNIEEFQPLPSLLARIPWPILLASASGPLCAFVIGILLLGSRTRQPWKSQIALALGPLAITSALAWQQARWLGVTCALALAALSLAVFVAIHSVPPQEIRKRTAGAGIFAAALFGIQLLCWPPWFLSATFGVPANNLPLLAARDLATLLRQRLGDEPGVIAGGFTVTSEILYFGGFRGLGTAYWENHAGLRATTEIIGADTDEAALAILEKHGVTHIVDASWDFFSTAADRLLRGLRKGEPVPANGFFDRLERGELPAWLRPVLALPGMPNALVYEIDPGQSRVEALVRTARFSAQCGAVKPSATFLAQALALAPDNAPALIVLARLQASQNEPAFAATLRQLDSVLARNPRLEPPDEIDLAAVRLASQNEPAARMAAAAALAGLDSRALRRLAPSQLRELLEASEKWNLPFPPGLSADFARGLLPNAMRPAGR
jgi:hypothetical protein